MTLHVMDDSHRGFIVACFKKGGYTDAQAAYEAQRTLDIAAAYSTPCYFVGPDYSNPRWYVGAFIDDTHRAILDANTIGVPGPTLVSDARQWLSYIFNELGVILLEAFVWVEDLKKEYLLRGLGFQKKGSIPNKVDIPGKGVAFALNLVMIPEYFEKADDDLFKLCMKQLDIQLAKKAAREVENG